MFSHEDTPFILAFSIVMLNTDLHNSANTRKMTKDAFIRNNRGIDDGNDLPRSLLEEVRAEQATSQRGGGKMEMKMEMEMVVVVVVVVVGRRSSGSSGACVTN